MAFSIDIDFDYFYKLNPSPLFDPATPNGKAARDTVRKAANDWAQYIDSDFVEIPQGTSIRVPNTIDPNFPNTNNQSTIPLSPPIQAIQDITIFVGTRSGASRGDNIAQTETGVVPKPQNISSTDKNDYDFLNAASNGINRQPSVGSITFNYNKTFQVDYQKIVNPSQYDLYTVALHEIFHILAAKSNGFTDSKKPALAFDVNLKSGSFSGINATKVVSSSSGRQVIGDHFVASTQSPPAGGGTGLIPELLVPNYNFGDRRTISELDLAVLADVGYQIINSGFNPTPISLTAPVPLALVSGYAVAGTKQNDTITGNIGNDTLAGDPGDDNLAGLDGNDTLSGGYGDDSLAGGLGDDVYIVDSISDQILENLGEGTDKIIVASYAPLAVVNYFKGATNRPANVEISQYVDPLNGATYLVCSDSDNTLNLLDFSQSNGEPILIAFNVTALSGNDTIIGGAGQDSITGDAGDDSLVGGDENDNLIGGEGSDSLAGNR